MNKNKIIKETLLKLKAKGLLNEEAINKYLKEYNDGYGFISTEEKYLSKIKQEIPADKIVDNVFKIIGSSKTNIILVKIAKKYSIDLDEEDEDDDDDFYLAKNAAASF